jgi:hypothetical protein
MQQVADWPEKLACPSIPRALPKTDRCPVLRYLTDQISKTSAFYSAIDGVLAQ